MSFGDDRIEPRHRIAGAVGAAIVDEDDLPVRRQCRQRLTQRRQQHGRQNRDNRDDHEQLNQCEGPLGRG